MRYFKWLIVFCFGTVAFVWVRAQTASPGQIDQALDILRKTGTEPAQAKTAPTNAVPAPLAKPKMTPAQEQRLRELLAQTPEGTPTNVVVKTEPKDAAPSSTLSPEEEKKVLQLLGQTPSAAPAPATAPAVPAAPAPAPKADAKPTPAPAAVAKTPTTPATPVTTTPPATVASTPLPAVSTMGNDADLENKARSLLNEILSKRSATAAAPAAPVAAATTTPTFAATPPAVATPTPAAAKPVTTPSTPAPVAATPPGEPGNSGSRCHGLRRGKESA